MNNKNYIFNCENVLDEIEKNLRKQGFAGKTDIPKIVFLAAITRIMREPVSLVVMGPSGSGKTYSIESGLQFIPPEAIENIAGMSEKALPYLNEVSLKHRILYLGEAAGMADGNGRAFLRQLMSEGKLDYLTVQKTANGMKGEKLPTVEGPIAFMMATTANHIHHEDQSRMLTLNVEEDPERIREALINKALGRSKIDVQLDLGPWHEFHKEITENPPEVSIPFAEKLARLTPITNLKIQRDFSKVLSLTKACALVHMNSRDKEDENKIIADYRDYTQVYNIINKPMSEGLENSVKDGVRKVVESVSEISKNGYSAEGISHTKLSEALNADRSVVGRNIHAAISQGYLVDLNPGKGRESKVILGERKLPSGNALPSPQELFLKPSDKPKIPW